MPKLSTMYAKKYFISTLQDLDFFFFIINTILIGDFITYHAKKLELEEGKITESEVAESPEELMKVNPGNRLKN